MSIAMDFAFDFNAAGSVKTAAEPVATRVCDRCIQRRVKCDLARPTCSRCSEAGWPCVYSNVKRRPGPPKGSRKKSKAAAAAAAAASSATKIENLSVPQKSLSELSYLTPNSFDGTSINQPQVSPPALSDRGLRRTSLDLTADQTTELVQNYFIHLNPAVLLLRHDKFLVSLEQGLVSPGLKTTILCMSAKLIDKCGLWDDAELEATIKALFDDNLNDSIDDHLSMDDFRQACLLAYLSFYEYPGEKSWQRIGQLARKAYSFGLHQIDNRITETPFFRQTWTEEEMDEWRYIWWCIFTLDGCSNITAATPYSIETESIGTAMPRTFLFWPMHIPVDMDPIILLPPDTSELLKTYEDVKQHKMTQLFNTKLVSMSMLREAGNLWRLSTQNPSGRWKKRQMALDQDIAALQAAFPPEYFNFSKDPTGMESTLEHYARLAFVMHLEVARILVSVETNPDDDEQAWLHVWNTNITNCGLIVAAAKEWDTQQICNIDPSLCFIIMTALLLVHTHKVCGLHPHLNPVEFQTKMEESTAVLLLILQQFARTWKLPRLLIASFEKFTQIVKGPLTPNDIMHIMRQFQGPLHQKWLGYVAVSAHAEQQKSSGGDASLTFDPNLLMQDWGFSSWEDVANFTTLFGFGDIPGLGA